MTHKVTKHNQCEKYGGSFGFSWLCEDCERAFKSREVAQNHSCREDDLIEKVWMDRMTGKVGC
jgi:hypothetical protein